MKITVVVWGQLVVNLPFTFYPKVLKYLVLLLECLMK
jgi:hypothetical protein